MFCSKCGKKNEEGNLYCSNCGNKHEIVSEREEIINRKSNLKIALGIIIVIVIGTTIFLVNKLIIHENTSSDINNEVTQASTDTVSQSKNDLSAAEKEKKEELVAKEKTAEEAKEKFRKLLQDKEWLSQNAKYKNNNSVQFLILDINQDGISEMLLYNKSGSLASYAVYVVTYNDGNVNVEDINASHGGFMGYLSDEKVFLINGMQMGVGWGAGYKLEGNKCQKVYSWESNSGRITSESSEKLICKLNDSQVSEEEYNKFCNKFNKIDPNSVKFYEINNENIEKYLGVNSVENR